jgi:hypothetical protein
MEKQDQRMQVIQQQFDNILIKHVQRLLGTPRGVGGIPLNLLTISCLIFIAEQHANEQGKCSKPEDRYTHDTLLNELADVGLGSNTALKSVLGEMVQKEYVHISESGMISAKDPVPKMARLLDKILPQMPGLNLVAYIAQTIEEAASNRKDLESAIDQFDQTLTLQGVSITKEHKKPLTHVSGKKSPKQQGSPGSSLNRNDKNRKKPTGGSLLSATDRDRSHQVKSQQKPPKERATGPKILSSGGDMGKNDIQEISFGVVPPIQEASDKHSPMIDADPNPQVQKIPDEKKEEKTVKIQIVEEDVHIQTDVLRMHQAREIGASNQIKEKTETTASNHLTSESEASLQGPGVLAPGSDAYVPEQMEINKMGDLSSVTEVDLKIDSPTDDTPQSHHDEVIADQINSFEETLAMQCPVCKTGKIIPEKTAKGKTYYKCPNKTCNFISWGKPYHHVCPSCQNPFLIEGKKNGTPVLKCPRATCRYYRDEGKEDTQADAVSVVGKTNANKSPKPPRRVVRRRVVRRKK